MENKKVAIVGTVGLPANYGGFETLVENLARYHNENFLEDVITVYCSSNSYSEKKDFYLSIKLKYIPLNANGPQSIAYDVLSLFSAVWSRNEVILLLGVSGAIVLPLIRFFSSAKIITNIDGIEWRRQKWQGLAKWFLHLSEKIAVRFSHEVIADNGAIADYVKQAYGVNSHVIAYGGDHVFDVAGASLGGYDLPESYAFSVCRIEPENNIEMIVEAFSKLNAHSLVLVGNWDNSPYGRGIRERFSTYNNLHLLDPIYDLGKLRTLRSNAFIYIHGHSAGGTNPSLVEAMHFGIPVLAFDCNFNRSTTDDKALFFNSSSDLKDGILRISSELAGRVGSDMLELAQKRYTWSVVARQYFSLFK